MFVYILLAFIMLFLIIFNIQYFQETRKSALLVVNLVSLGFAIGLYKKPDFFTALVPVAVLLILLICNIKVFKDDTISGSNQLALLFAAFVSIGIGIVVYKIKYEKIEQQIVRSITMSLQACLILFIVGAIIGIWILSGVVPTMIYYGLKILNPNIFLPAACLICMIVSTATGSSWSTSGTVGIALMGIGKALGIPDGMIAGAILSGAYFGDKMSPLSDTTNLAPAMAGTDVFTHVKNMMQTTIPSIGLALVGFTVLGVFQNQTAQAIDISNFLTTMESMFTIHIGLFIVPAVVVILVLKKMPAVPALLIGFFLGVVVAVLFQQELLKKIAQTELSLEVIYMQIMQVAYNGFQFESGDKIINSLFNRGGMASMLKTVWLIFMAMTFGGAMEGTGMLQMIAGKILTIVKGAGSLIGATLASCFVMNMIACDQYIAIVLPGRMFKVAYSHYKLHPKNLSRALEDSGTITSVLIPWNSCGAYHSGVLGVSTLTYLPYCLFNILNPLIAAFYAGFGIGIAKETEETRNEN